MPGSAANRTPVYTVVDAGKQPDPSKPSHGRSDDHHRAQARENSPGEYTYAAQPGAAYALQHQAEHAAAYEQPHYASPYGYPTYATVGTAGTPYGTYYDGGVGNLYGISGIESEAEKEAQKRNGARRCKRGGMCC